MLSGVFGACMVVRETMKNGHKTSFRDLPVINPVAGILSR